MSLTVAELEMLGFPWKQFMAAAIDIIIQQTPATSTVIASRIIGLPSVIA